MITASPFGVPPPGIGRGYAGYGAVAPGYHGTAAMVGSGYGYGKALCKAAHKTRTSQWSHAMPSGTQNPHNKSVVACCAKLHTTPSQQVSSRMPCKAAHKPSQQDNSPCCAKLHTVITPNPFTTTGPAQKLPQTTQNQHVPNFQ